MSEKSPWTRAAIRAAAAWSEAPNRSSSETIPTASAIAAAVAPAAITPAPTDPAFARQQAGHS